MTADLKVFAAHRLYGIAAATALTVQSTQGVFRVQPVSAELLAETLDRLAEDLPIAGIKIGMLATGANVDRVADFLERLLVYSCRPVPIVLDPVLRSTSGHSLLDSGGLDRLRVRLLPLVSCVTPNTTELHLLSEEEPGSKGSASGTREIEEAADGLVKKFPGLAVVATGGHLEQPVDYVVAPGAAGEWLPGDWVRTAATHGTGCAYSSALLSHLVLGLSTLEAARAAKGYVTDALRAASPMGQGGGSMHHLYAAFSGSPLPFPEPPPSSSRRKAPA